MDFQIIKFFYMKSCILSLFLLHFVIFAFSQEIGYQVRGLYQYPILKEKLNEVKTLKELNPGFPSSWISQYFSVEVSGTCNGEVLAAKGKNATLSEEQLNILNKADLGSDIVVEVKYSPKNTLINEDNSRLIHFKYTVIPDTEAEFPGGYELLLKYLKDNTKELISPVNAKEFGYAAIQFTVNEEGEIMDAELSISSEDEQIDKSLLEVVKNMPKWNPAKNSQGVNVQQDFEFTIGNMIGC